MLAALPSGSNALIFALRDGALQTEATATIVLSTLGFALTLSFWLAVLAVPGAAGAVVGQRVVTAWTPSSRRWLPPGATG